MRRGCPIRGFLHKALQPQAPLPRVDSHGRPSLAMQGEPAQDAAPVSLPAFYSNDTPASANEMWQRLHADPLFAIKHQEQSARRSILANPVQMQAIKAQVETGVQAGLCLDVHEHSFGRELHAPSMTSCAPIFALHHSGQAAEARARQGQEEGEEGEEEEEAQEGSGVGGRGRGAAGGRARQPPGPTSRAASAVARRGSP